MSTTSTPALTPPTPCSSTCSSSEGLWAHHHERRRQDQNQEDQGVNIGVDSESNSTWRSRSRSIGNGSTMNPREMNKDEEKGGNDNPVEQSGQEHHPHPHPHHYHGESTSSTHNGLQQGQERERERERERGSDQVLMDDQSVDQDGRKMVVDHLGHGNGNGNQNQNGNGNGNEGASESELGGRRRSSGVSPGSTTTTATTSSTSLVTEVERTRSGRIGRKKEEGRGDVPGGEEDVDMDADTNERLGGKRGSGSSLGAREVNAMQRPNHPHPTLPINSSSSPIIKTTPSEISPTSTTAIDPSLSATTPGMLDPQSHTATTTTTTTSSSSSSSSSQRPAQTGPTRTHSNKPAPLNLRSISNSTVGSGTNDVSLNSPYAGSYAARLGERPTQHSHAAQQQQQQQQQLGGGGRGVGGAGEMNDDSLRYPGAGRDDRPPHNESISRPAPLAHSASLPVLPSHGELSTGSSPLGHNLSVPTQGGTTAYSAYPGSAAPFNRAYSYAYAQHEGEGNVSAGYEQGSQHAPPQVPPPFQHAYTSPAVPMYTSGGGHHYPTSSSGYPSHGLPTYSHLHHPQQQQQQQPQTAYPSYASAHHYQPPGTMSSPSFMGPGATGGYPAPGGGHHHQNPSSANTTPGSNVNTPGVLVIGANGQIMPHNTAQMVGGRGTPLSERPFKCDECVQSFNRNHDLKRHKRIHLDVKPFACEKCGKQFSRKDALRRHWLVKGCKASDDPNVNMVNPAYQANKPPPLSPPTPENQHPPSMALHAQQSAPSTHNQHVYPQHPSMLRTPSYGGGPMVVTPDDEAFGGNGYSAYGPGPAHPFRPHGQQQQQQPMHIVSANTSPSSRPSGGPMSYAPAPQRNNSYDRMSTPGSAGLHHPNGNVFPGQFDPSLASSSAGQPFDSSKLPGRFSLDARLHPSAANVTHHDRPDVGPRSASVSTPVSDGITRRGTPVMVVQADGMVEESVPGQNNVIKRISRDDYFEGVFTPDNGSNAMDQALDAYGAVSSSNTPKLANQTSGSPQFAMPFEKGSRPPNEPSTGPGSEAWSRWHRPSFPFPHASGNVYRTPDSMEDSTDLRKSISHRASVSQQHTAQQNGGYPHGGPPPSHRPSPPSSQRWTRASFPFPENPSNAMGIRPTAGGPSESAA